VNRHGFSSAFELERAVADTPRRTAFFRPADFRPRPIFFATAEATAEAMALVRLQLIQLVPHYA
jgi:hypothetical protein